MIGGILSRTVGLALWPLSGNAVPNEK
jgi:hypothetical protein